MSNHDENGKFAPGNKASPGRPRKVVESAYLAELLGVVTVAEWRKVAQKALADAKKGHPEARRWISEYIIGKPPQILELRAAEAALLRDVLNRFEARGVPASDVFNAMLALMAEEEIDVSEVEQDER